MCRSSRSTATVVWSTHSALLVGAPLVIAVHAPEADWVGMFSAGGMTGFAGAFACPERSALCVVVNGLAYLIDVDRPGDGHGSYGMQCTRSSASSAGSSC